jgi:hypothetical protein
VEFNRSGTHFRKKSRWWHLFQHQDSLENLENSRNLSCREPELPPNDINGNGTPTVFIFPEMGYSRSFSSMGQRRTIFFIDLTETFPRQTLKILEIVEFVWYLSRPDMSACVPTRS